MDKCRYDDAATRPLRCRRLLLLSIALATYLAQVNLNTQGVVVGVLANHHHHHYHQQQHHHHQQQQRVPQFPAFASSSASSKPHLTPTSSPHFGTHRSNVYLGIRGLFPTSPLFGWAWSCAGTSVACSQEQQINNLRHDAEENDNITKWGWLEHNGADYAKHEALDTIMGMNLTAQFLFVREKPETKNGEKFFVRMIAEPVEGSGIDAISLYSYVSLTSGQDFLTLIQEETEGEEDETRQENSISIGVTMGEIGEYVLKTSITPPTSRFSSAASPSASSSKSTEEGVYYYGVFLPLLPSSQVQQHQQQYETWQAKQLIQQGLSDVQPFDGTLPNTIEEDSNFMVIQRVCWLPCVVDYVMQKKNEEDEAATTTRHEIWLSSSSSSPYSLSSIFSSHSHAFRRLFDATFPIPRINTSLEIRAFSSYLLSNLLGGIGYFYGTQLIEVVPAGPSGNNNSATIVETAPSSLFTATPCRSFFPRGFMWDEGFHQLLISRWNLDLSLSILASWFSQVHLDYQYSTPVPGWLPREQILGNEARARVPQEYWAQNPTVANPPTMMVTLRKVLERLIEREEIEKREHGKVSEQTGSQIQLFHQFLQTWLPVIHQHVQWFFVTQASISDTFGPVIPMGSNSTTTNTSDPLSSLPFSFRWQGRTLEQCLPSGLDDYPRADWLPTDEDRTNVTKAQQEADRAVGITDLVATIGREGHVDLHAWMIVLANTMSGLMEYVVEHGNENITSSSLNYTSLSSTYSLYTAALTSSLHSLHYDPVQQIYSDYAYKNGTREFITHIGYVALLPLFLNVIDSSSPNLLPLLKQLRSSSWSVWSSYGIRSLSTFDPLFGQGDDYWRGHIWINMQVLACQGLEWYAENENATEEVRELAKEIAAELKHNIVTNVGKEFKRKGFVYEQYHAMTGEGRRSFPFTGWTALTLLLMTDE